MPKDLPIWNYFEQSDFGHKTAVCNYCHRELSYRTTITNLKAHLKQKHNDIYNEFLNVTKNPEVESLEKKPTNEESDVEESPNNTYQEVVYLYDSDSKSNKKEPTPVKQIKKAENQSPVFVQKEKEKEKKERDTGESKKCHERRKRRRMSMFVEEESTKTVEDAGDEEIDKFGKYVVCLMKTVPRELCTQLQMDMINLIMTAKIKYMAKPAETSSEGARGEFIVLNDGKVQRMQIADDGQDKTTTGSDPNDTQNTYEEVVYLQDSETKTVKEIRLKKLDAPDKKENEHRKRRLNSTFPDDTAKAADDEEIEKFGKYITCLMKTVPNDLGTQLQMDIINTIMRGKIKYLAKQTAPSSNVIVEKIQTDYQPSIIVTVANENAHMPIIEASAVVATHA